MFNLQSLVAMASQAMLKKLISSDSMYSQWNTFCKKWGLPQTSRAEFDNLTSFYPSFRQVELRLRKFIAKGLVLPFRPALNFKETYNGMV